MDNDCVISSRFPVVVLYHTGKFNDNRLSVLLPLMDVRLLKLKILKFRFYVFTSYLEDFDCILVYDTL